MSIVREVVEQVVFAGRKVGRKAKTLMLRQPRIKVDVAGQVAAKARHVAAVRAGKKALNKMGASIGNSPTGTTLANFTPSISAGAASSAGTPMPIGAPGAVRSAKGYAAKARRFAKKNPIKTGLGVAGLAGLAGATGVYMGGSSEREERAKRRRQPDLPMY